VEGRPPVGSVLVHYPPVDSLTRSRSLG
jgi:hypothetical protein